MFDKNNQKRLIQGLSRLLRDDQFVDVTLVINNPSKLYSSDTDSGDSSNEGKVYILKLLEMCGYYLKLRIYMINS